MTKLYNLYVSNDKYTNIFSVEEYSLARAAQKALDAYPDTQIMWDPYSGTEITVNEDTLSAWQHLNPHYINTKTYEYLLKYQKTNLDQTLSRIDPSANKVQRLIPIIELYYRLCPEKALALYNNRPKGDVAIKFPFSSDIYAFIYEHEWREYRYLFERHCLYKPNPEAYTID